MGGAGGGFSSRNVSPHSSVGWKPEVKMLVELVSSGSSLLSWSIVTFSLGLHVGSPLCVSVHITLFIKTCHIELGPTLVTSFYLNYLFKESVSKSSHHLRSWGLELQHRNFEGHLSAAKDIPLLAKVSRSPSGKVWQVKPGFLRDTLFLVDPATQGNPWLETWRNCVCGCWRGD